MKLRTLESIVVWTCIAASAAITFYAGIIQ